MSSTSCRRWWSERLWIESRSCHKLCWFVARIPVRLPFDAKRTLASFLRPRAVAVIKDGAVAFHDAEFSDGNPLHRVTLNGSLLCAAYSPCGGSLAVGTVAADASGDARAGMDFISIRSGEIIGNLRLKHAHAVHAVCYSPCSRTIAIATTGACLAIAVPETGAIVACSKIVKSRGHAVCSISFSRSGQRIAAAIFNGEIQVLDAMDLTVVSRVSSIEINQHVSSVLFSSCGVPVVVANNDERCHHVVWLGDTYGFSALVLEPRSGIGHVDQTPLSLRDSRSNVASEGFRGLVRQLLPDDDHRYVSGFELVEQRIHSGDANLQDTLEIERLERSLRLGEELQLATICLRAPQLRFLLRCMTECKSLAWSKEMALALISMLDPYVVVLMKTLELMEREALRNHNSS